MKVTDRRTVKVLYAGRLGKHVTLLGWLERPTLLRERLTRATTEGLLRAA